MTETNPIPRPGWLRPAGITAVLCGFAALTAWSFGKWPDVLVDFGRELYVPWRLVSGDTLYRDIAYFNGPLSPYWNAALFSVFGTGFATLVWANLALAVVISLVLFALIETLSDAFTATVGVVAFICVFAFGHLVAYGNYNFIAPYSHEMVHGFALSLGALAAASRSSRSDSVGWRIATGGLLGLVFLTKAEVFAAAVLGSFGCGALGAREREASLGAMARWAGPVALSTLVVPLVAWAALSLAMPAMDALRAILGSWPGILAGDAGSLQFYRHWMGVDDAAGNTAAMFLEFSRLLAVIVLAAIVDRVARGTGKFSFWAAAVAFAATLGVVIGVDPSWMRLGRSLPLVALAGVAISIWNWRRQTDPGPRAAAALGFGFSVFALALLAKMLLFARVFHYGFALAAPAALVGVVIGLRWIPDGLRRSGGDGIVFRAIATALVVAAVLGYLQISDQRYGSKIAQVGSGADAFLARPAGSGALAGRAEAMARTLSRLAELPDDASVLALPEGVMINYLARRRSPTPYINFLPPELILFGEHRIVAVLEANPPAAVVFVHKDTSEYGYPRFGRDYGRVLMDWVRSNYTPSGPPIGDPPLEDGSRFGIAVWKPPTDD